MPASYDDPMVLFGEVNLHCEDVCPNCSNVLVDGQSKEAIEIADGDVVYAQLPTLSCVACDFSFFTPEAELVRDATVRIHLGLLTAAEIKEIREKTGFSRREFAEAFGIPSASMERWENGRLVQNKTADTLLRALKNPSMARTLDRRRLGAPEVEFEGENVIQLRALKTGTARLSAVRSRAALFELRRM